MGSPEGPLGLRVGSREVRGMDPTFHPEHESTVKLHPVCRPDMPD